MSASGEFLALSGYRLEQVLGRHLQSLVGPRLGADLGRALQDVGGAAAPNSGTSILERTDGFPVDVAYECSSLLGGADEPGQVVVLLRATPDAPPVRCRRHEVQQSLVLPRGVARTGSWVTEPGPTGILHCSPEMLEIFGLTPEELERDPGAFVSRFAPEDRARIGRAMRSVFAERCAIDLEHRIVLPSGEVRWIYARLTPARVDPDGPDRVIGVAFDITDRVLAEAAARESEQRFRAAAEVSLDGLVLFRARRDATGAVTDFEITELNRRAEAMFGRSRAELIGRGLCELWPAARDLGNLALMVHVLETGEPWLETLDHTFVELAVKRMRVQVVRLGDGLASTMRDVTGELALMDELARSRQRESLGRIAAGIAHDFNNMLSVIMCFGTVASRGLPASAPQRAEIAAVLDAAERASRLTRRLLALGRRQVLEPRGIDLNVLLSDLERIMRRLAGGAVRVDLVLGAAEAPVWVDPVQLEQVIVNLVINARDAMPDGGTLRVETSGLADRDGARSVGKEPGQCRYVRLTVADTGCGMTPEVRERIFDPFFTTKEAGGTGLGLASVRGFVKQSGGFITVNSAPGQGTTVTLCFPQATAAPRRTPAPPPSGAARVASGHLNVLLVDQDQSVREAIRRVLREHDFTVLDAGGAAQAMEIVADPARSIDLLLADVHLPGTDGLTLARRVRELRPEVAVVYMSSFMATGTHQDEMQLEGAAFLAKPATPESLLRKIQEALATPTTPEIAATPASPVPPGPGASDAGVP